MKKLQASLHYGKRVHWVQEAGYSGFLDFRSNIFFSECKWMREELLELSTYSRREDNKFTYQYHPGKSINCTYLSNE